MEFCQAGASKAWVTGLCMKLGVQGYMRPPDCRQDVYALGRYCPSSGIARKFSHIRYHDVERRLCTSCRAWPAQDARIRILLELSGGSPQFLFEILTTDWDDRLIAKMFPLNCTVFVRGQRLWKGPV